METYLWGSSRGIEISNGARLCGPDSIGIGRNSWKNIHLRIIRHFCTGLLLWGKLYQLTARQERPTTGCHNQALFSYTKITVAKTVIFVYYFSTGHVAQW